MYKSDFNYNPNPFKAPCYKGKLCSNHKKTHGQCRNNCSSFNEYKAIKDQYSSDRKDLYVSNEYKQEAVDRQNRRY